MNIPSFWAAHTIDVPYKKRTGKDKTLRKSNARIRRYGWSNSSVEVAKQHAIERCEEAKQILLTTGNVKKIEPRGSYLVEGLPIREEVVQKYPDLNCVTTINVYGATCLNSEDVMILDIDNYDLDVAYSQDKDKPKAISLAWSMPPVLIFVFVILTKYCISLPLLALILFGLLICFILIINRINTRRHQQWLKQLGGYIGMLEQRLNSFVTKYPNMVFNIYETPLGWRLIALNNTYLAQDEGAKRCFEELPVDTQYARLCQIQNCFRARVTAKPWNTDIDELRIPARDFWEGGEDQQKRREWLNKYENHAASYAACRFIKQVGTREHAQPDSEKAKTYAYIDDVVALHDTLSRSRSELPIA